MEADDVEAERAPQPIATDPEPTATASQPTATDPQPTATAAQPIAAGAPQPTVTAAQPAGEERRLSNEYEEQRRQNMIRIRQYLDTLEMPSIASMREARYADGTRVQPAAPTPVQRGQRKKAVVARNSREGYRRSAPVFYGEDDVPVSSVSLQQSMRTLSEEQRRSLGLEDTR